ncbi:MAG TPA: TonB-dependent receptor, partial [Flavobacterium sp.]|nr:TonB-dependent receptor [Flavobacterium sp.]
MYVSSVKDSAVIDYTLTDKNGNFSLSLKKQAKPFNLKISSLGYETYVKQFPQLAANLDLGELLVNDAVTTLGEVVIVGEAPPIRIKNDTLEFNASSFKVRPDSNVESLLKQLPGVEIDKSGKITVNGKEVNEILVNGKSFFGKDGAVAIKNLPSDIIDKIQVSDAKTKEEKLSGEAASSDKKSINITIQEDKNKGLFGKFTGGYGTDSRYEASGLLNYFKDKQKISFLGSSNNINATGFSMDEIFDAMGGGRNRSVQTRSDGTFNINGMEFGGGSGITQSSMAGLNFADEWFKKIESSGSYFYTNASTENETRSRSENFLTSGSGANTSFITESSGASENRNEGHNASFEFEYKLDPSTTLSVRPRFVKNSSSFESTSERSSSNSLGLVNESTSSNYRENNSEDFESQMYLNRKLKRKGRNVGFTFNTESKKNTIDDITDSETFFYQDPAVSEDIRRQRELDNTNEKKYYTRIGYSEPITDSMSITVRTSYEYKDYDNTKSTFNFSSASNAYSNFNSLLSYNLQSQTRRLNPSASLNLRKKKFSSGFTLGTQAIQFENISDYNASASQVNKNYVYPTATAYLNMNISKSKSFYLYYDLNIELPAAEQILPV